MSVGVTTDQKQTNLSNRLLDIEFQFLINFLLTNS